MQRPITRRRLLEGALGALASVLVPWARAVATSSVEMICRRAWGADPPGDGLERHRIRRLTVHHSAKVLTNNRDAPARFRSHQADHMADGWPDIAYHLLIDRNGNLYEGRRWRFRGDTATDYDPRGHLLVMCEGNFDEQKPSKSQQAALVDVLAWASTEFDVPVSRIRGHRDYAATACPGAKLYRLLEDGTLRRRVRRRLRAGGVGLEELCGKSGKDRVKAIEAGED